MKGVILAGGLGTSLRPLTRVISKQLLPVYNKPMIYYPLSVLMLAGIRDILIISTPRDLPLFQQLLGDGSQWGLCFTFAVQPRPEGLAQAFIIGRNFVGSKRVCLILGDNLFHGSGLEEGMEKALARSCGATIFACPVKNPARYGVLHLDARGKPVSIEEKPVRPSSNLAVTGLYFYDNQVLDMALELKPSGRGELEITDINRMYLERGQLAVEILGRGDTWLDMGTHDTLLMAGQFIEAIEKRSALSVGCVEEVAFRKGYISADKLLALARPLMHNAYGRHLERLAQQENSKHP